jgi:hypothetical protein
LGLTDRPPKVLHQDLCLFHLGAEHFRSDHGAEGHLLAEFLGDGECERRLSGSRSAGEEECAAGEAARLDQLQDETACLGLLYKQGQSTIGA